MRPGAALDRARQGAADRRADVGDLAVHDPDPIYRARASLGLACDRGRFGGDGRAAPRRSTRETPASANRPCAFSAATAARTATSNTRSPRPRQPPAALKHLDILLALADDPDAGVRRELILALRNLPTDKVGDALRKLAASWDGQTAGISRRSAWRSRSAKATYLSKLFDGTLYGELDLDRAGKDEQGRAAALFPGRPQRGVHRDRHAGPAGQRREQVPRSGLADSSARGACRCSSASSPTCEPPSCNRRPTTSWSG